MLVMFPGQKPSMVRVDQLSYAWSQDYKRLEFVKFRHLLANTEQGDRSPVLSKPLKGLQGSGENETQNIPSFPSYFKN